jgi:hypothetical protein
MEQIVRSIGGSLPRVVHSKSFESLAARWLLFEVLWWMELRVSERRSHRDWARSR